jgi:HpcH/HpaI aldolase/citrate lyase family
MLGDDGFDSAQTGGRRPAGYGAEGARRNTGRPIGYDKNAGAMPSTSTPQLRICPFGVVCALLEDVAVLENLDAILSVPGIDLYSIGPNDFAQILGYPGQPDHPEVVKTMQEITRRIRQAGRTMQLDVMQGA